MAREPDRYSALARRGYELNGRHVLLGKAYMPTDDDKASRESVRFHRLLTKITLEKGLPGELLTEIRARREISTNPHGNQLSSATGSPPIRSQLP